MKPEQLKAWSILNKDEKEALSLQFGLDKSSWQAGEILDKSHYKYLEIKYRAAHFMKMFTTHFMLYDELIPSYIEGDGWVISFFRNALGKRLKPMDALELTVKEKSKNITKTKLNEKIITQLRRWQNGNVHEVVVFNLIKEYDRWNNFRILPQAIREPSAYKRRIKNVHKRRIKLTSSIPEISLKHIEKIFKPKSKEPFLYLPVISNGQVRIIKVKDKPEINKVMNDLNLYLFAEMGHAVNYGNILRVYVSKSNRECKDGLDFWPNYRELIRYSKNYEAIDNIIPSRRYLKLALNKLEFA